MFSDLYDYCRRNWVDYVKKHLAQNPGIDITKCSGICVQLAIKKSSEMLEALLEYHSASLPTQEEDPLEHAAGVKKLGDAFDDQIDFDSLSPEMQKILFKYFPSIAAKGMIEAAGNEYIGPVKTLYHDCRAYDASITEELLDTLVSTRQAGFIEEVADMEATAKEKAIILSRAADLYSNYDDPEKTALFYEKAIAACDDYLIPHLHYANYLQRQFCTDITFDPAMAAKAESCYKAVTAHSPTYSYAHKKLGILYQIWSEHDQANATNLAKQAIDCYIMAIQNRAENLRYDSLYSEIEYLAQKYELQGLEKILPAPITDEIPQLLPESAKQNDDHSSASSTASTTIPHNDMFSLTEEDIEYEECYMDGDLEQPSSSGAADAPQHLDSELTGLAIQSSASSSVSAAAHDSIDDSPPLSLSGHNGYDSDSD